MDDDTWWLQIGRHGQHLTVWVTILADGTPQVALTEDETESETMP